MKAVVFDLDGVITDTAKYHFRAWKHLAESIGIHIDEAFNEHLKGIGRMDSLERILKFGGRAPDFSEEEKSRLAEQKNEDYRRLIAAMTPNDILPGIQDFLEELRNAGIKIGLASASKNGPFILKSLQISSYFDTIVDPAKLKKGKPDPEIFSTAAVQLGAEPRECAGIEDAVAGIQSINAAGLFSVGVGVPEDARPDWRVASTLELTWDSLRKHWIEKG
ncbi:beta-phosphoglucomutase [Sporolactobacillus shoreae]|uniref:Beta-phosphoglucomutase n=1 Tax=Sporolactobacillus shoreae TaxID=1465501 RepID=A0A4Z0GJV0_9BACL|nr:beta-phosphoglucomutase [Sporolactobacillus shoreae]TGA97111.1 beta-phosphoglucomutase [Sporolactobacillus shoreae]